MCRFCVALCRSVCIDCFLATSTQPLDGDYSLSSFHGFRTFFSQVKCLCRWRPFSHKITARCFSSLTAALMLLPWVPKGATEEGCASQKGRGRCKRRCPQMIKIHRIISMVISEEEKTRLNRLQLHPGLRLLAPPDDATPSPSTLRRAVSAQRGPWSTTHCVHSSTRSGGGWGFKAPGRERRRREKASESPKDDSFCGYSSLFSSLFFPLSFSPFLPIHKRDKMRAAACIFVLMAACACVSASIPLLRASDGKAEKREMAPVDVVDRERDTFIIPFISRYAIKTARAP